MVILCILFTHALNECAACLKMAEEKRVSEDSFSVFFQESIENKIETLKFYVVFYLITDENVNIRIGGFSG